MHNAQYILRFTLHYTNNGIYTGTHHHRTKIIAEMKRATQPISGPKIRQLMLLSPRLSVISRFTLAVVNKTPSSAAKT